MGQGEATGRHDREQARTSEVLSGLFRNLRRGRLTDPDLRYRRVFERVSDGFALVEVIRDEAGVVVDYLVLDANPALLRILGFEASPVGKRQSEAVPNVPPEWLRACGEAVDGEPLTFEYQAARSRKWYEIHLTRVGHNQLAQLVVDITERKRTERRTSEMFDELNHRVKNNLSIVSALLSMQARTSGLDAVRAELESAVTRIQAIADAHASLYRTGRTDQVAMEAYLQNLCDRLRQSVLDPDRIALKLDLEPVSLPLDRAVTLGVLLNELVTNAAKHAYPPPSHGEISVCLNREGEELVLTVGDSGPGLPSEPPPRGLGMRIVRSLAQQLGARLEIQHHPGATFHVRLPCSDGSAMEPRQSALL
jgi:two-component sensor histidine kinase